MPAIRWLAVLGWAATALWLLLRFAQTRDTTPLVIGVICLAVAALIAVGGAAGRAAGFVGILVAGFLTVGFVVVMMQGFVEAALGAFYMIAIAVIGYRAANPSEDF
jgi:1,4-dihydroxy-2-naphthoate octaprenyltransferase